MQKNYYLILGVSANATEDQIKAAFRRRAQELRPDYSGQESSPFLEIQEAYGVLSDPDRRHVYNRQNRSPARRAPWGPAAEPLVGQRPKAEPLRQAQRAGAFPQVSLAQSFDSYHPSFEELFDRLWGNFEGFTRPKAERLESLTVEVMLTAQDARHGGRAGVRIPARATCPAC